MRQKYLWNHIMNKNAMCKTRKIHSIINETHSIFDVSIISLALVGHLDNNQSIPA